MKEPLSEDDYPDDRVVSFQPFVLEGDKISLNYIKEENKDYFKPLNVQVENSNEIKSWVLLMMFVHTVLKNI